MQAQFSVPALPPEQRSRPLATKVKLSPDSLSFLRSWVSQLEPYDISEDSLVELSVQIVRQLQLCGRLDLSSKGLHELFSKGGDQCLDRK
jgi:hypothetical protein